ncbi:MAG: signal peptidase II [Bacteroidales bacterium]
MKTQNIIVWVLILITIDQAIKILIHDLYGDIHFEIIPSLFEFKPTFNVKHSWINTLLNKNFGVNVGLIPHVILYILIGIFIPMFFSYFRNIIPAGKKLIDISIVFMMSAVLCALIGNIIWKNGTLDYIYLKPLFVFDLKDLYSDLGIITFLIYAFKNRGQFEKLTKEMKIRDVYIDTKNRLREINTK